MEDTNGHRPEAPTVEPDRIVAYLIGRLTEAETREEQRAIVLMLDYWTGKP